MVLINKPSTTNESGFEALDFLVVEETPLLDETQAMILAGLGFLILIIGISVQVRILIILTNHRDKMTAIKKLFLANCILSLVCHPPLIIYSIVNGFIFPMSNLIGISGCVVLIHFTDVFIRVYSLFFPLAIVTVRYVFVLHNLWVKRQGINRLVFLSFVAVMLSTEGKNSARLTIDCFSISFLQL